MINLRLTGTEQFLMVIFLILPMVGNSAESSRYSEEIIVIEKYLDKPAQETAIAITAMDAEHLETFGVDDPEDIAVFVPSFSRTEWDFTIRGVGRNWRGNGGDPGVASYQNGVYVEEAFISEAGLYDVSRVEILRGPQGTLYGRDSIGGAVNYVSNPPTSEFAGELVTGWGSHDSENYMGFVSGPIIPDVLNARLSATKLRKAGDRPSRAVPGQRPVSDTGGFDDSSISLSLEFNLTESINFFIRGSYRNLDSTPRAQLNIGEGLGDRTVRSSAVCFPEGFLCFEEALPDIGVMPRLNSNANQSIPISGDGYGDDLGNFAYPDYKPSESIDLKAVTVEARWHFGYNQFVLRYLGGYSDLDYAIDRPWSIPGGRNHCVPPRCTPGSGGEQFREDHFDLTNPEEAVSHEVQLISNFDGPINFVAGYFNYQADITQTWDFYDNKLFGSYVNPSSNADLEAFFGPPSFPGKHNVGVIRKPGDTGVASSFAGSENGTYLWLHADSVKTARAIYGTIFWQFREAFTLSVGGRYSKDKKVGSDRVWAVFEFEAGPLEDINALLTTDPITGEYNGDALRTRGFRGTFQTGLEIEDSWEAPTFRINLDWRPRPKLLTYFTVSSGYRAGGHGHGYSQAFPFKEEKVMSFELGIKSDLIEDRLRLNAAAYYYDYENHQIATVQPVSCSLTDLCAVGESPANTETVQNIPESRAWGIELESSFALTPQLSLGAVYSYMNTRITADWIISKENNDLADSFDDIDVNHKGSELTRAPKHKYTLWGNYNYPLGDNGNLDLLLLYAYTSEQYQAVLNVRINQTPDFDRWDARLTWTSPTKKFRVTGFVQNIQDKLGVISIETGQNFGRRATTTSPRAWGIEFQVKFGALP